MSSSAPARSTSTPPTSSSAIETTGRAASVPAEPRSAAGKRKRSQNDDGAAERLRAFKALKKDLEMNVMIDKITTPWTKPARRGKKPFQNCRVDDNEKPGDINNSTVAYDLSSDYPTVKSRKYTGPRVCKGDSFGERDIAMMKHRLGISNIITKGTTAAGKPIHVDKLSKVSTAFGRELLRCLGAEGVKQGKLSDKQGWDRALRRLINVSELLPENTKKVLSSYSSIMVDTPLAGQSMVTKRKIPIEHEEWDQERRWMWHALEVVCQDLVTSQRASAKEAKALMTEFLEDDANAWFRKDSPPTARHPQQ
jgi:hypothetical protein